MNFRTLVINDYGRLRSAWRILIFLLAFIAFLITSEVFISRGHWSSLPHGTFILDILRRLLFLIAGMGAGYLCVRLLEGLPWRSLGLTFQTSWLHDLLVGSVVGILTLVVAVSIATAFGALTFSVDRSALHSGLLTSVLSSALLFVFAALAEEAAFRGYILQTLSRAKLAWLGVLLTSVPFGLVHLSNPNVVRGVTFTNTALAGIWLAFAYLRTRSLWLPLGVHWSWNWALGALFGLPVSGLKLVAHPVLQGKDLGPAWLTGGSYGIEGGAACTVALLLSSLFLWRTRLVSANADLMALTSQEKPVRVASVSGDETDVPDVSQGLAESSNPASGQHFIQ